MAKRSARKAVPKEWPAAKVETRKVEDLVPYARNARTHSGAQVAKIAASIQEFGWTNPVLVSTDDTIIAGHGRILAAAKLGVEVVPVHVAHGWSEAQVRAYVIADNQLAIDAGWDNEILALEIAELGALDFDLGLLGFDQTELDGLLAVDKSGALAEAADADLPEVQEVVVSRPGDLWILGGHRVLCGDCTRPDDFARVMDGEIADCIMADPPYGMGKESDGVLNDNLYREKLDDFQMKWIEIAMGHTNERGSLYVWGNAPDLWRLWYQGGLNLVEDLTIRNEIVWDKGNISGMKSGLMHSYSIASERCLFIMRGQQFLGSQNKSDYSEIWDPLRLWMLKERKRAGWKNADVDKITGSHMAGHWFTKSQFQPISEEAYNALREAADGVAFVQEYGEVFVELYPDAFPSVLKDSTGYRRTLFSTMRSARTFFDNAHEAMTDVWRFGRVLGDDRFGHATPKPVGVIGRGLKSSLPDGGIALDPFLGTGTTLIAADALGSRCFGLELEPAYVDVIVRRWQKHSGKPAKLDGTKSTFAAISKRRGLKK